MVSSYQAGVYSHLASPRSRLSLVPNGFKSSCASCLCRVRPRDTQWGRGPRVRTFWPPDCVSGWSRTPTSRAPRLAGADPAGTYSSGNRNRYQCAASWAVNAGFCCGVAKEEVARGQQAYRVAYAASSHGSLDRTYIVTSDLQRWRIRDPSF